MIVYFSIMINNAFSVATNQSVHYAAMGKKKKEIKSIDRPENNNNNRNNDNKWTGATVSAAAWHRRRPITRNTTPAPVRGWNHL